MLSSEAGHLRFQDLAGHRRSTVSCPPGIEGVRNNYLGKGGLSYCPGSPAYSVHRPSLLSALTLRMATGAVRDEYSLAPYYLQDKHLTFQDGVSGLTQPLLDLLPRDFSSPSPPKRSTHHPLYMPRVVPPPRRECGQRGGNPQAAWPCLRPRFLFLPELCN